MVNRGRPSRGCQNCKARRIKCDETRPECRKCTSTGRKCPGVPDDFDLVLRNQTASTTQKSRRSQSNTPSRASSVRQSPKPTSRLSPKPSPSLSGLSPPLPIRRASSNSTHLSTPQLNDETTAQAVNFFFQNHYHVAIQPFLAESLVPIYSQVSTTSVLHQAVEALALMAFSNHFPTRCLRDKAVAMYAQALRSVNAAINDPEESRADSTLLAIFLLCMYEITEGGNAGLSSYSNYMRHLDGAVALLRHRGTLQFQDQTSLRLFQAARIQMIHTYLINSRQIPAFAPDKDWLSDSDDYEDFSNAIVRLSIEMAAMRARARALFISSEVEAYSVSELLQTSLALDEEASLRYNSLSGDWRPTAIPCYCSEHSNCSHENPCPSNMNLEDANIWLGMPIIHIYSSLNIAHEVMNYYIVRMFANAMVLRCLRWFTEHGMSLYSHEQYEQARGRLQQVVDNICCSVPYHTESAFFMNTSMSYEDDSGPYGYAPKQGAYFILTPLHFASLVEPIAEEQRAWIRGQLQRLSKNFGLRHAEVLCSARPCVVSGELPWQATLSVDEQ